MDSYARGPNGLRIRQARAEDRSAVLAMTREVWGGDDYMPYRWHQWLASPQGYLYSAVEDDRVIGLGRVREQEDASGWIEGIRVDRHAQSRGVGTALVSHGIEWARSQGLPRARLSTASTNVPSTRMAEAAGMRVVAELLPTRADTSSGRAGTPEGDTRIAYAQDADDVLNAIKRLRPKTAPLLYTEGWTAHAVSLDRIRMLCARQCVLLSAGSGSPSGVAIVTCVAPFTHARMGLLLGEGDAVAALTRTVLGQAMHSRLREVRATVALDERQLGLMREQGFSTQSDMLMYVHEIDLTGR